METKIKHSIENFDILATSSLRVAALRIAEKGFSSIATRSAVRRQVFFNEKKKTVTIQKKEFNLKNFDRVMCIGFGKAAFEAVSELQEILTDVIQCGYVIDLKEGSLGNIKCKVGTHPYPTKVNIEATKEMLSMLENCTEKDLVLCVVSGGGSALLCYPHDLTCEAEVSIIAALTVKGATIQELNTVRKHISKVKGGNLAKLMYPATVVGLLFSDVPGDDISMIASGPTVLDVTHARDAAAILEKYDALQACEMPSCKIIETPKEQKYFEKVHNFLIVSGQQALNAMAEEAEDLGYKVEIFSRSFQGEAKEIGKEIISRAKKGQCLLGVGESTVTIRGKGKGGRNQEMALSALQSIGENQVLLCAASDGHDNTDSAGAIVDASTGLRALSQHLDPKLFLENNDSFHFFEAVDSSIHTGLTGANVADFFVLITE
jgi:glycerate 2-kinase